MSIVAHASKRNLIGINSLPIGISIFGNIPLIIPALIRRITDKSYLSFKEIVENGLAFTSTVFDYERMGYYVEENTDIDILNLYKDYLEIKNSKLSIQKQKIYADYRIFRDDLAKKLDLEVITDPLISSSFLTKYPELLK